MENYFYNNLTHYLKSRDTDNANRVIMEELANILIKDRESFQLLLTYADISLYNAESDAELIHKFIDNININRKLMVGSAFLINQQNKRVGFDGEEEISDAGVKAVHKVMFNYFDAAAPKQEQYSNIVAELLAGATKVGADITKSQLDRKHAGTDLLLKKATAKQTMLDTVLKQRAAQQAAQVKKAEEKAKTKKILLISGVSLLGLALVIGGIYLYKRNK